MAIDMKKNLRENKGLWIFLAAALVVTVSLAVFVAPRASKNPDGLEKVARDKGFANKAEEKAPVLDNGKESAGTSGLLGVIITLAVATAVGLLALGLNRLHKRKAPTEGQADAP
jgi:cobalt/nickel transport system permease protein